jgi:predicted aspartyl protease
MIERLVLAACLIALLTPVAKADDPVPVAEKTPGVEKPTDSQDILKFSSDRSRRMTVNVSVDGKGPYPFIVDSGAERTALAREVATELDLSAARAVMVQGLGGTQVTQTVILPKLAINELTAQNVEVPLLLRDDLGAAGVIGIDFLQSRRVVIDFKSNTMSVTASTRDSDKWEGESIVILAHKLLGELVLADASVGNVPINVIVDTGAQVSVGNDALRRLLYRGHNEPLTQLFDVRGATGDLTAVEATVVRGVRIGGIEINNLPVAFADAHLFRKLRLLREPTLLLGMDALQLFDRVAIDFARRNVRFAKIQ